MNTILRRIILAGLFIIPFIPFLVSSSFFFPFITTKAFVWRIVVEIVFVGWVALAINDLEYRPKRSKILWAFAIFLLVVGLADFFGVAPIKSFWSNFERMEGFVALLHMGAFFVVAGSMLREREWTWWWNTSLVASVLMVCYCAFQLLGSVEIHQGGVRVDGTFGNAAYLAVYMLIHIFVALIFYVRTERGRLLRWVYGVLIFLQIVILYYTATRGAILGLLGGLFLAAILNVTNKHDRHVRKASIVGIVGFVILVGAFMAARHSAFVQNSPVLSRFASISSAELKTEGRSFIWPMALQGIKERPFLGWGQENFNYVFEEHYSPAMFRLEPWFDRAHNIFLDWGVSAGVFGLLSYLSLYALLLWSVWKVANFTRAERSIFTGLLAAYFVHNFFVFDNLGSYILFAALLAYVHSRASRPFMKLESTLVSGNVAHYSLIPLGVLGIALLYFVNITPMMANANLIKGLQATQSGAGTISLAMPYLHSAYNGSRLGRSETVEWIASSAGTVLSSSISDTDKQKYYDFAKEVIEKQAKEYSTDARYQLIAGSFLTTTGHADEALPYLTSAQKLMPGKQQIYFELGSALITQKKYAEALENFKLAYEAAPEYTEGQVLYVVGAIYAGNVTAANEALAKIPQETLINDNRIANALLSVGEYQNLITLLKNRLATHPESAQNYADLAVAYARSGDKANAIAVLEELAKKDPSTKDQVNQAIEQIKKGAI